MELGGLSEMLQCSSRIVYVDRLSSQSMGQSDFGVSYECGDSLGSVVLLLRPGHYDLLYSKADLAFDSEFKYIPIDITNDFYYYCNVAAENTGRVDLASRAGRSTLCLGMPIASIEDLTRELIDQESNNISGKFGLLVRRNDAFGKYFSVLTANPDAASDPSSVSLIQLECLLNTDGFDIMSAVQSAQKRRGLGLGFEFSSGPEDPSLIVIN